MKDEEVQRNLILDQKTVNNTIEKTLTSEKGKEFWKNTFEDTKFAEGFAKTLQTEHEKVIKRLMKDPEYQGMLMDVLKNPQMEEELLKVLKSKEYRQYLQQQITDVLSSPLFQPKIEEALLKAAQQAQSKQQGGAAPETKAGAEANRPPLPSFTFLLSQSLFLLYLNKFSLLDGFHYKQTEQSPLHPSPAAQAEFALIEGPANPLQASDLRLSQIHTLFGLLIYFQNRTYFQ